MTNAVPVKGLKEVLDTLEALPKRLRTSGYRRGLTAAAAVVRDEARLRAPRQSGKLAKAIRSGSPKRRQDGNYAISVRLTGNNHAFLGLFFEYGVAPHMIPKPKKGEAKAPRVVFRIDGKFVSGPISHPGIRPQPFLLPALDAKAAEAVQAFRDRIIEVVQQKTGFDIGATFAEAA